MYNSINMEENNWEIEYIYIHDQIYCIWLKVHKPIYIYIWCI